MFCVYTSRSKNLDIQEVESKSVDSLILFVVSQHRQWWSDIFYLFFLLYPGKLTKIKHGAFTREADISSQRWLAGVFGLLHLA